MVDFFLSGLLGVVKVLVPMLCVGMPFPTLRVAGKGLPSGPGSPLEPS